MMSDRLCPHCGHDWWFHMDRCSCGGNCGCLWPAPSPPSDPSPAPNPRQEAVVSAIWSALRNQDVYADPEMGVIDTSGSWTGLDMYAVADAVIEALETLDTPTIND